jgi:hypothetical protein
MKKELKKRKEIEEEAKMNKDEVQAKKEKNENKAEENKIGKRRVIKKWRSSGRKMRRNSKSKNKDEVKEEPKKNKKKKYSRQRERRKMKSRRKRRSSKRTAVRIASQPRTTRRSVTFVNPAPRSAQLIHRDFMLVTDGRGHSCVCLTATRRPLIQPFRTS